LWKIKVFRQIDWKGFLPYCAHARKEEGNKIQGVNAEGKTPQEALEKVKQRIKNIEETGSPW